GSTFCPTALLRSFSTSSNRRSSARGPGAFCALAAVSLAGRLFCGGRSAFFALADARICAGKIKICEDSSSCRSWCCASSANSALRTKSNEGVTATFDDGVAVGRRGALVEICLHAPAKIDKSAAKKIAALKIIGQSENFAQATRSVGQMQEKKSSMF